MASVKALLNDFNSIDIEINNIYYGGMVKELFIYNDGKREKLDIVSVDKFENYTLYKTKIPYKISLEKEHEISTENGLRIPLAIGNIVKTQSFEKNYYYSGDDGRIQQAGKPEEFYNNPANIFVAQFIGSPTINIIDGSIQGNKFVSECGMIKMQIDEDDFDILKAYDKKPIKLGIRSERFLAGEAPDLFQATVDVIEMLGKEKTLYVRTENGVDLTLTFPGHFKYNQGEVHTFGLDPKAVHYFDAETGESIFDRQPCD